MLQREEGVARSSRKRIEQRFRHTACTIYIAAVGPASSFFLGWSLRFLQSPPSRPKTRDERVVQYNERDLLVQDNQALQHLRELFLVSNTHVYVVCRRLPGVRRKAAWQTFLT